MFRADTNGLIKLFYLGYWMKAAPISWLVFANIN